MPQTVLGQQQFLSSFNNNMSFRAEAIEAKLLFLQSISNAKLQYGLVAHGSLL